MAFTVREGPLDGDAAARTVVWRADGSTTVASTGGPAVAPARSRPRAAVKSIVDALTSPFVPSTPVTPDYWRFQLADSIQGLCSYLRGILSLASTLAGAGNAALPMAAVLTFVLKDGAGMIAGLVFGGLFATAFDGEVRFWRLFADVINDIGLTVELLAPLAGPSLFLPVTCCANICKALCGVAAGATRVTITQHFAGDGGNVAEVQAKEGAQETAVTLAGLLAGLWVAQALNADEEAKWVAFAALTALHVIANYYAVRVLALRRCNATRAAILAVHLGDSVAQRAGKQQQQGALGPAGTAWRPPALAVVAGCEGVVPMQYASAVASALLPCWVHGASSAALPAPVRISAALREGRHPSPLEWLFGSAQHGPVRLRLGVSLQRLQTAAQHAVEALGTTSGRPGGASPLDQVVVCQWPALGAPVDVSTLSTASLASDSDARCVCFVLARSTATVVLSPTVAVQELLPLAVVVLAACQLLAATADRQRPPPAGALVDAVQRVLQPFGGRLAGTADALAGSGWDVAKLDAHDDGCRLSLTPGEPKPAGKRE